jgi:predicted porin
MKKSLIALAVLAASGAVMAQSSVTLYGVADVSLAKSGQSNQTATAVKRKTEMSSGGTMNNGTSRLGVRGTEDIGGGLKVSFNYEQNVNNESGATAGFTRQAWVSVDGGFGGLRMGRAFTPSYRAVTTWELTGAANYSVVANSFGYNSFGSRDNSQFTYTTPNMGGFTGQLSYIFKQDFGTEAKFDLALGYVNGPLAASFGYNKVKGVDGNAVLGASYDFGSFKLAGSLQDGLADQKGFTLGATVPMGAFSFTADLARDTEFKDTDFLLEAKYAMSKRTTLYAAYLRDGEDKRTFTTASKNNIGLGIRHNF